MRKQPKSQTISFIKKGAAFLLAAEVFAFAGCYYVYHRMNTDRDFRYYMKNNYPFALEGFYSVGEFFQSKDQTRKIDSNIWSVQHNQVSDTKVTPALAENRDS